MSLVLRCLWLMEHQKLIWAQCDTFLRTWVCQGHMNIINEQEADWRATEWQREGERTQTGRQYFVSNMIYIYLWFWWWLPQWVMETHLAPTDLVWLPTISLVQKDKSMAVHFLLKSIWKITSPFALSYPVANNSYMYKGNFSTHLSEDSYMYLGL